MQSNIGKPGLLIRDLLGRRLIIKHSCYFSWVASQRTEAMTACIHGLRRDRSPEIDGLRARARDWQIFSQSNSLIYSFFYPPLSWRLTLHRLLFNLFSICLFNYWMSKGQVCFSQSNRKKHGTLAKIFYSLLQWQQRQNRFLWDFYENFFLWFTCSWQHFLSMSWSWLLWFWISDNGFILSLSTCVITPYMDFDYDFGVVLKTLRPYEKHTKQF